MGSFFHLFYIFAELTIEHLPEFFYNISDHPGEGRYFAGFWRGVREQGAFCCRKQRFCSGRTEIRLEETAMKKIINSVEQVENEMVLGLSLIHI